MLLLTNGTIATMDPARPMAEAAVVDGAYFAYVGGRADAEDFARRFSRGAWETLDLQGCFVMPGFNPWPAWPMRPWAGGWPGWRPAPAAGFWARGGTRSSSPASGVFPPAGSWTK